MNLKTFNTILSFIFAPTFILFLQFFDFRMLTMVYGIFMFVYLIFSIIIKADLKTISTPLIYFVFIVIAYYFISMESIKAIPALISGFFFFFFLASYIGKRQTILKVCKKFYTKSLSEAEESFIASSDGYWAFVTFTNVLIQVALIFVANNTIWAFYSSVGWYIYLGGALLVQIIYGKLYNIPKREKL